MRTFTFVFFWLLSVAAAAQTPARVSVRGQLTDTTGTALPEATVMLLMPRDSSLVQYGRSDEKGNFELRSVRRGTYLLKTSYSGFLPAQKAFTTEEGATTDLGTMKMKPIARELMEVVVKTARAPLNIRGDTIEYNASQFKVPAGSTVEDLLRRLPGMEVDADGNIRSQGREVRRVLVDGKRFFGDDPKAATKNLDAAAIDKVQVFDSKSEQAQLTGVDDGKKEKTVNLALKEEFKKGGFGKITTGAGTAGRRMAQGNYNKFDSKNQFSVLGRANNTNDTDLSWDDRQDFYGSQLFSWDQTSFGFGGGITASDDEREYQGFYFNSGGNSRGITNTYAGGANYNFDTKKKKFNANYFYTQRRTALSRLTRQENFLNNSQSYVTNETADEVNASLSHAVKLRYEQEIDSLNTVVAFVNANSSGTSNFLSSNQDFLRGRVLSSSTSRLNTGRFTSYGLNAAAVFRHKFRQKGRTFSVSINQVAGRNEGSSDQRSGNVFFTGPPTLPPQLDLLNHTDSRRSQFRVSGVYVQPFARRFFWETFYNFGIRRDDVTRHVQSTSGDVRTDTLSRSYQNLITYHRLGSSIRYSYKGLNMAAGLAGIQLHLNGDFTRPQGQTNVSRTFVALVPNVSFNYNMKQNAYLGINYMGEVTQPAIEQLQPIVDYSNPRYITQGNPDLKPSVTRNASFNYGKFNMATSSNFFLYVNYEEVSNAVVYSQRVDSNLVTYSRPINLNGQQNMYSGINLRFPIVRTKANFSINGGYNYTRNLTPVNEVLNRTLSNGYRFGGTLDLTPSQNVTFNATASFNLSETRYSINTSQNQHTRNESYRASLNLRFPQDFFLTGGFSYNRYVNDRFGFNQGVPLLNAAVYKLLGKARKWEVRVSGNDLLNRNRGISQFASSNFVRTEQVTTLRRYFLLSFTYNMRGISNKLKKNNNDFFIGG